LHHRATAGIRRAWWAKQTSCIVGLGDTQADDATASVTLALGSAYFDRDRGLTERLYLFRENEQRKFRCVAFGAFTAFIAATYRDEECSQPGREHSSYSQARHGR